ncbi:MAG: carbamoyl phosphate synthase small subunit [Sphingomonadaceae bacterium]
MRESIVLSDGTSFEGTRFGSPTTVTGEVVLYTGVVGWQEVLTDPCYAGKIVVFTYPHVGNYGVNDEDVESSDVTVRGIVVRDLARFHSNFRAKGSFRAWVEERGIAGLDGVDTRAIMVHARNQGIGTGAIADSPEAGLRALRETTSPFEWNLVAKVQGICRWPAASGLRTEDSEPSLQSPPQSSALGPQSSALRLGVLDLGGKYSLYRQMAELGCALRYFPWNSSAELIAASGVDGLLLPPGPGDPNRLGSIVEQVHRLVGKLPILGIGLGFQVLALALGGRVVRLKAGRHGVNYPVRSTRGEPSMIVACHHSFAVDGASLPPGVDITYVHLNEGTAMGLEARGLRAWGYQFHPGWDGDNRPSPLLARFVETLRTASA